MTIDEICEMTTNAEVLNALHACREGHPNNSKTQWRNAFYLVAGRREFTTRAIWWLRDKAQEEERLNGPAT
jgi:hypothetical protein